MYNKKAFAEWLDKQLIDRNMTQSELARRGNFTRSALNGVLQQRRGAGRGLLIGIANGLGVSPETVFKAAGLIDDEPDAKTELLAHRIAMLPESDYLVISDLIDTLIERQRADADKKRLFSKKAPNA